MVLWSARRGPRDVERVRPRVAPAALTRVDFTELVPEPIAFLGQAAHIQLETFEALAKAVASAPTLGAKEGLSAAAGVALRKHHALIAELRRAGAEPVEVMAPFTPVTDRFREAVARADWYELLLTIHVTAGMLDDFFARLAAGLPNELAGRVRAILERRGADERGVEGRGADGRGVDGRGVDDVLRRELERAIAEQPGLADRLALWGRSLVGDALLVARSALRAAEPPGRGDEDVEPVFTELIAEHTRRMDALGLTA
ncbi:ferritin-like fold-containing protein [Agromyces aerolatus]|uniref:ferritin-like fold-containing protein n=1 Tax=Agromyces sp. LY-1074 TaxID=3074080 RepID=UPI002862A26C|nr:MULTISPECIES: ferritin-like fold-containing protein [unclassified Agromyces]MDR5698931.1 ferritin-like fold-containing protein [Agromyces sp. LY-1074]MDR5705291.1 ferritin-like fold-containing protein [Agromyces sp. LY-1358]